MWSSAVGCIGLLIFGALTSVDMDLEALASNVRDLQEEGFLEPEGERTFLPRQQLT